MITLTFGTVAFANAYVSFAAAFAISYAKAKGVATSDMAAAKTSYENKTTASAASASISAHALFKSSSQSA